MKKATENRYRKLITHWNPKSSIAETYRTLRTNLQFASIGKEVKSILVTSTLPGEGKTTTATNLAVVMGQAGKKTIYVDGDLRRPTGYETLHVNNFKGITSYLVGNASLDEIIQETDIPNVSVITSGPIPPNPAELLGSEEMGQLIKELKNRFEMVIVDSAPALAVADPIVLSTYVDGCLIVIHSGKTNEDLVEKIIEQLKMVDARILGVVLNKLPRKKKKEADYYYYQSSEPVIDKKFKRNLVKEKQKISDPEDNNKPKKSVENFRRKVNHKKSNRNTK